MTVPYTQSVSTARLGGFFRLLFRWRGSIYQVIYGELIIFIVLYYVLNLLYRYVMTGTKWETGFKAFAQYCESFADFIPVTFVLGFYVVHACSRRWTQWENLPWPDKLAFEISGQLIGDDQKTRMLRRTLIRYANLASVLCFRDISIAVRKRFPTLKHMAEGGLMNEAELEQYKRSSSGKDSNWWIPFHWAYNLIYRARIEGKLNEGSAKLLQDDVLDMRQKCWILFSHDWVPIPMVYTQVATLAVYLFMLASLFGRQHVKKDGAKRVDLFVPVFPFFQVMFYLGWLKVGEVLTNPFGGDADDFEMNYIIDRNLRISYSIVDENYNAVPPIEKDAFWNTEPEMPYTDDSAGLRNDGFIGSAVSLDKPEQIVQTSASRKLDGDEAMSRANSVRGAMRSGRQALARPLSRLISRDRAMEPTLLESSENEELEPVGVASRSSPTQRRQKEANLRAPSAARLPSIVESTEAPLPYTAASSPSVALETESVDGITPMTPLLPVALPNQVFWDQSPSDPMAPFEPWRIVQQEPRSSSVVELDTDNKTEQSEQHRQAWSMPHSLELMPPEEASQTRPVRHQSLI